MIEYCGQQNSAVGALMALKDFGAQILPIDFAIVDFWSPPPCSLLSGVEIGHVGIDTKFGDALLLELLHLVYKLVLGEIAINNPIPFIDMEVRNDILYVAEILINTGEFLRLGRAFLGCFLGGCLAWCFLLGRNNGLLDSERHGVATFHIHNRRYRCF